MNFPTTPLSYIRPPFIKQLFCTLNPDFTLRSISSTFSGMFENGLEWIGSPFTSLLTEESAKALNDRLSDLEEGESVDITQEFQRDGRVPLSLPFSLVPRIRNRKLTEIIVFNGDDRGEFDVKNPMTRPFKKSALIGSTTDSRTNPMHFFLEQFLANAPVGFCFLSRALRFSCVNESLASFAGFAPEQLIGRSVRDLFGSKANIMESSLQEILRTGMSIRGIEVQLENKGIIISTLQDYYPISDSTGYTVGICGTVVDISEQKNVEMKLIATEQDLQNYTQLLRSSNEELSHFAQVASHDLKEPLRAVSCHLELLKGIATENKVAGRYVSSAISATGRMKVLIKDLLDFCRVGADTNPPVSTVLVREALDMAIANLQAAIEESHAQITFGALPVAVAGDKGQLSQLFQNLIENALKYRNPIEEAKVAISCRDQGGSWVFDVQDNGLGIEAKNLGRVFKVFERLHTQEEYPGTGIGLATCKRIVERHGGEIWVESQINSGSNFKFTLPKVRVERDCGQKSQESYKEQ